MINSFPLLGVDIGSLNSYKKPTTVGFCFWPGPENVNIEISGFCPNLISRSNKEVYE